jgi:hypothetical protein
LVKLLEEGKDDELGSRILYSELEGQIAHVDRQKISIKPKHVEKGKTVFFILKNCAIKK